MVLNRKKLRVGAIFLLLGTFVGCISSPKSKPQIVVAEVDVMQMPDTAVVIDFGRLQQGEVPFYEFAFRNTTDAPLVILGFETECGCVVGEYPTKPIEVGDMAVCRVEFYSAGQFGQRRYDVGFELSSGASYDMQLCVEVE